MENKYINNLIHSFKNLKKYENLVLSSEFENVGSTFLIKNSSTVVRVLEVIDAENIDIEDIKKKSTQNDFILNSIKTQKKKIIIKLFVFKNKPTDEKVMAIISNQYNNSLQKMYIKCISIITEDEKISKHYLGSYGYYWIKGIINRNFNSTYDSISNDKIRSIIKNKGRDILINNSQKNIKLTYKLILINVFLWIVIQIFQMVTGLPIEEVLLAFGTRDNVSILSGDYFRLFKAIFLHVSVAHLLMNCYILYGLGPIIEKIFGKIKYIAIYLISGIFGNLLGFALSMQPGVGASGALFGLIGAILYVGIEKPLLFKACFGKNMIFILGMIISIGFFIPNVDNYAHIGGLIGGFLVAGVLKIQEEKRWYFKRASFLIVSIVLALSAFVFGFISENNKVLINISKIQQNLKSNNWENLEMIAKETLAIENNNKLIRSIAISALIESELATGKFNDGEGYCEELKNISPFEGYYYKGKILLQKNKFKESVKELEEAKKYSKTEPQILAEIDAMIEKARLKF